MQVIVELVKALISFIASFLKNQWGKIILTVLFAAIFFLLIFPYGDLTSYASRFIFEKTGIPTRSKDLGLIVVPLPGARISGLEVNISSPPLSIAEVSFYPSLLSSLLKKDAFFSADLENIFGGNVEVSRSPGDSIPEKEHSKEVYDLEAEGLELAKLLQFLKTNSKGPVDIPIQLKGKLSLKTKADMDPLFTTEPTVEFLLSGNDVLFPSQSIPTAFGPLQFPEMKWKEIMIKGRLVGGELILETVELGKLGDPLLLKTKGRLSLRVSKVSDRAPLIPRFGAYEFDTDLTMSPSVEAQVGILLTPIAGNYKSQVSGGFRYLFRASGSNFRGLPRTQPIRGI